MNEKLCDTHTHIYFKDYKDDFKELMTEIEKELEFIVSISCDFESTLSSLELSLKYSNIFATIGYHPVDISKYTEDDFNEMIRLAKEYTNNIIAFGEIGLDYHWMKDSKEKQITMFKLQLNKAKELDLPVIIHSREALDDTINILKESDNYGILHAYPGDYESCKELLDRFYIGIGGTVTFKNNLITKELVKKLPLDKIVIETDSPFLTPVPFRGKRNNPTYVKYVAEEISKIKGIDIQEVINVTTRNAKKVFKLEDHNIMM